jgi:alpha-glucosidase
LVFFSFFSTGCLFAQNNVRLTSPDGRIQFILKANEDVPVYSITYKKKSLVENSSLNLDLEGLGTLTHAFISAPVAHKEVNESYKLKVGKTSSVKNHYRQTIISLQDKLNKNYKLNIEVRVFNDGVAFRYSFPKSNDSSFTLLNELTQFRFTAEPLVKALLLPNFVTSHEGLYTTALLSEIKEDTLIDMPALFQFPNKVYMAITEAALLDYAGMYLSIHQGVLTSILSPLPNQSLNTPLRDGGIRVKATLPHKSPWRVLLISDRLGSLIESNIITSLNAPSVINDLSWIKPGTSTFPWWNGTVIPDSVVGGNNFETNKYYIDFCAANNIK